MKQTLITILCFYILTLTLSSPLTSGIGYRIGNITNYNLLKQYNKSKLYNVECPELDDQRSIKLLELVGTHYQAGYAYAALLGPEILETYHTMLGSQFQKKWQLKILELFLEWQYDTAVGEQISHQFKQELKGI